MADVHFTEHPLQYGVDGGIYFEVGSLEFVAFPGHKYGWLPIETTRQPLTVIPTDPGNPWTKAAFLKLINDIEHRDDVSQAPFRRLLLFWATREGTIRLPQSLKSHLAEQNVEYVVVELQDADRALPAGPYLWYDGRLGPIYRLYEDSHSTFIGSLRPGDADLPLKPFRLAGHDPQTLSVPVPSRQPLLGVTLAHGRLTGKRILIKDIFDVRGLKMSACSRAFLRLATPSQRTAPAIQRLLDEGAAIVGTAKLSSMISREEPSECIDFCAPFNPRGDRSQSPAGSSSGSAAAIAAYDWLDYAIGSDSTGSTRRPAGVNGCFAIRLSTTALPAEGILPCFKLFDAPSLFCRDVNGMADFVQAWCGNSLKLSGRPPTSVFMPMDYFPVKNNEQQNLLDQFARDVCACFKIPIRKIHLHKLWEETRPANAHGYGLKEFLRDVGRNSFIHDFYHSTDDFRSEYERRFEASPQVNRVVRWRWEVGKTITTTQRDEAIRRLSVYKAWLLEHVFRDANPIMLLPVGNAEENYRDDKSSESPVAQEAWDQLWLSPILGAPEITIPIGQVPFESKMTHREEMLPVVASLVGLLRTDLCLIEMAKKILEYSKRPTRVATGRQMFVDDWDVVERTRTP